MSTNLSLKDTADEHDDYAQHAKRFLEEMLEHTLGCELQLCATEQADELTSAWSLGLELNDQQFAMNLSTDSIASKFEYFGLLSKLAQFASQCDQGFKLISPSRVPESQKIVFKTSFSNSKNKQWSNGYLSFTGQIDPQFLTLRYGGLRSVQLADLVRAPATTQLLVAFKSLDLLSDAQVFLAYRDQLFSINICQTIGGYRMELESETSPAELEQVALKVTLGELTISLQDFVKLKPGSVIEFNTEQPLRGFLELAGGAQLAEITLQVTEQQYQLTVNNVCV